MVALSYEPVAKVMPYAKQHGMDFIVGGGAKATEKVYDIRGYPTMFVIDPSGRVAWKGHSPMAAEQAIQRVLAKSPPTKRGTLPKRGTSTNRGSSTKRGTALEEQAARAAYQKADRLFEKKRYADAIRAYVKTAKEYKGTSYAEKARSKLWRIKADKKLMAQARRTEATRKCENWLGLAQSLSKSGKRDQAMEYYQRIIKEYPGSSYARRAREGITEL